MSDGGRHPEGVLVWRQAEFERLGFASYVAEYLATSRIDLHQMAGLLAKGCSHELAAQILAGTMWSGDDPRVQWSETDEEELVEQPA